MTRKTQIQAIQGILGVKQDGAWGPLSQAAFTELIQGPEELPEGVHPVIATSFADPADVAAFRLCKGQGKSDEECFRVGDNGIGYWKDSTVMGSGPAVALPPEDLIETWGSLSAAHRQPVLVKANGHGVIARVLDTMPHRRNIRNGAGLDCNPDVWKVLGVNLPVRIRATWQKAEEVELNHG
jgi:hypothetical protein